MWLLVKQAIISGAACCSSGAFSPAMIGRADFAQLGTSIVGSTVIGSSSANGSTTFLNDEESDRNFTHSLYGGIRLSDDWQSGASLSWFGRERNSYTSSETAKGFADSQIHIAYEPSNHVSVSGAILIPTAKTAHESKSALRADAFGRGLWTPSISIFYKKIKGRWDTNFSTNLRYAIGRSFDRPDLGEISVSNIWGASGTLGAGYLWRRLGGIRSGIGMGLHWDQGVKEVDRFQTRSLAYKMVTDVVVDVSIPLSREVRAVMTYKDQTLVGPTQNAELARSLSLSFVKAWSL